MTVAALTWPQATVYATSIAALGLVVIVLIWSIFRTGQTAIRSESRQRELLVDLRQEVDEIRARLDQSVPRTEPGTPERR